MTNQTTTNVTLLSDIVRAYDFDPADRVRAGACYVEGRVVEIVPANTQADQLCLHGHADLASCETIIVLVERDVFCDEELAADHKATRVGSYIRVPANGTPTTMGGTTNRVELIRRGHGSPVGCELEDLTTDLLLAGPGLASIVALNQGGITTAILRRAAMSYREDLEADGFAVVESAGPCALGVKAGRICRPSDAAGAGWEVAMVGPSGLHRLHVAPADVVKAGEIVTARTRIHWLGFLARNGVRVPAHLEAKARLAAEREERTPADRDAELKVGILTRRAQALADLLERELPLLPSNELDLKALVDSLRRQAGAHVGEGLITEEELRQAAETA